MEEGTEADLYFLVDCQLWGERTPLREDTIGSHRLGMPGRALLAPTESAFQQMVRFGAVGAVATVADIAILWFLTNFARVWYVVSAAVGYSVGLVVCYALSILWVFPHRSIADKRLEFIIFVVIGIVALALTEVVLYMGVEILRTHLIVAKIVAVVLVFFFNFGMRKAMLFTPRRK